ncbi:MAG: hypothetical protein OXC42_06785 [Gammaproteobacteria bacterium]|nr:hypothetical protein [Gammaproteobacteria bacterium]
MARKKKFNETDIKKLPIDKPAMYRIQTESGKDNYVGIAKKGRLQERLLEHRGKIPGTKVVVEQFSKIADAQAKEKNVIKRNKPKYNDQGK